MISFTLRNALFVHQMFPKFFREFTSRRNVNRSLLRRVLGQLGFCLFATPNFELTIQRTNRINENQKQNGVLGLIQVANAPRYRDNRQVNQIWIERGSANFTDKSDAEKLCHKALAGQKRDQEKAVQQNRERMVEEIVESGIQFLAH